MKNFFNRISDAQCELKCQKSQYNSFGKYRYRSCEDILEAVKPVCAKNGLLLNLSDKIVMVGDRIYVEATATLYDMEGSDSISSTASARESDAKKGMDYSQITGTASSYARKYALNGLFNIDDTKDADTEEFKKAEQPEKHPPANSGISCELCGAPIQDYNDGRDIIPAAAMAKRSKEKFGHVYCIACGKKAAK